jgi:hypothetical protein
VRYLSLTPFSIYAHHAGSSVIDLERRYSAAIKNVSTFAFMDHMRPTTLRIAMSIGIRKNAEEPVNADRE